jgi:uncharacterized protein involved in response to NO
VVFTYWLMALVVLVRLASHFAGSDAMFLVNAAAVGWVLVFAIFLWVHWPILARPRPEKEQAPGPEISLKIKE